MKHKIILLVIIVLAFILRIYRLDQVPPSLYWDEASLGYNAFSISQTLRDEHGVFLPVTNFAAFGDYKPVGYIYAIVPFIKLFGFSEIAVRMPSVIAGTLLVLVTYFLVKEKKIALFAALFVAVSPWALQMSRAGFEAARRRPDRCLRRTCSPRSSRPGCRAGSSRWRPRSWRGRGSAPGWAASRPERPPSARA